MTKQLSLKNSIMPVHQLPVEHNTYKLLSPPLSNCSEICWISLSRMPRSYPRRKKEELAPIQVAL